MTPSLTLPIHRISPRATFLFYLENYHLVGGRENGEKAQGFRSVTGRYRIDRQGNVRKSTGNGEAKERLCTTHGHGLREGTAGENGDTG